MKIEVWRPIPGYEGLYEVSDQGRVKSLSYHMTGEEHIIKPSKKKNGYFQIHLCQNCKYKFFLVHRLVWVAFNGPIPEGMQVNHINEDKTDNRLANLNLMTRKENCNWGTRNGRIANSKKKAA